MIVLCLFCLELLVCVALGWPIVAALLVGLVLFVGAEDTPAGETEFKLAQTIAAFLGRHMEG